METFKGLCPLAENEERFNLTCSLELDANSRLLRKNTDMYLYLTKRLRTRTWANSCCERKAPDLKYKGIYNVSFCKSFLQLRHYLLLIMNY